MAYKDPKQQVFRELVSETTTELVDPTCMFYYHCLITIYINKASENVAIYTFKLEKLKRVKLIQSYIKWAMSLVLAAKSKLANHRETLTQLR
jgi:hypothetical protein